jgi:hypothetical protein
MGLVSGSAGPDDLAIAGAIVASYGKGQKEVEVEVLLQQGERKWVIRVAPMDRAGVARLQIF